MGWGTEADTLEASSMLDDKYQIEALIAVGGMGAVYRGRHTLLKKTVAIKILKREFRGAPGLVERFQREAVAASQIGHEGIIEVTDIGTSAAGDPFLVMEHLTGMDLATCLKGHGAFPPAIAARICCEVLDAVAAAHDKGIIHRDLKPENVFVVRQARGELLKVLDFGISRISEEEDGNLRLTTTGQIMGTPYYMSPEQAIGDTSDVGVGADIYAVGVILYELITGAVPFKATNYNALLHQILEGKFPPASVLANISPQYEAIIMKAMSSEQSQRFTSARGFADALGCFAETSSSTLLPESFHPDTLDDGKAIAHAPTRPSSVESPVYRDSVPTVLSGAGLVGHSGPMPQGTGPMSTGPAPTELNKSRGSMFAIIVALMLLGIGGASYLLAESNGGEPSASSPAVIVSDAARPIAESFLLRFAVAPTDALVAVDGVAVDGASVDVPAASSVVVTVSKDGFVTQVRRVVMSADETLAFALVPVEKTPTISEEAVVTKAKPEGKLRRKTKPKPRKDTRSDRFVKDSPYDE